MPTPPGSVELTPTPADITNFRSLLQAAKLNPLDAQFIEAVRVATNAAFLPWFQSDPSPHAASANAAKQFEIMDSGHLRLVTAVLSSSSMQRAAVEDVILHLYKQGDKNWYVGRAKTEEGKARINRFKSYLGARLKKLLMDSKAKEAQSQAAERAHSQSQSGSMPDAWGANRNTNFIASSGKRQRIDAFPTPQSSQSSSTSQTPTRNRIQNDGSDTLYSPCMLDVNADILTQPHSYLTNRQHTPSPPESSQADEISSSAPHFSSAWQSCPEHLRSVILSLRFEFQWEVLRLLKPSGYSSWSDISVSALEALKLSSSIDQVSSVSHAPRDSNYARVGASESASLSANSNDTMLVFEAALRGQDGTATIELAAPKAYRKHRAAYEFGADRFLVLQVYEHQRRRSTSLHIALLNRTYQFAFAELKTKEPHAYYYFAISGPGLIPRTIDVFYAFCCPPLRNADITLCKWISRLKLSFSKPVVRIDCSAFDITPIDDVKSNGTVMTDGCGFISTDVMSLVRQKLGLDSSMSCSAIQMRIGNAKGMLIADNSNASQLIKLRHSMIKFDAVLSGNRRILEVLLPSRDRGPSRLSKQAILVLHAGGVPAYVFEELLREKFTEITTKYLETDDSQVALKALERQMRWMEISNNGDGLLESYAARCEKMLHAGFSPRSEPILFYMLREIFVEKLDDHLRLEVEKSRMVFIVPDPTGRLQPGQVFASIAGNVLLGDLLVLRYPCHLPTDIQKVAAVDIGELRQYQEVLVVSIHGTYPLAAQLSGGDYDGDQVFLCWDPRLTSTFQNTCYSGEPDYVNNLTEKMANAVVMMQDIHNVNAAAFSYAKTVPRSSLGIYTIWHEKAAASRKFGIKHPDVIRLAYALQKTVDTPKIGEKLRPEIATLFHSLFHELSGDIECEAIQKIKDVHQEEKDKLSKCISDICKGFVPDPAILSVMPNALPTKAQVALGRLKVDVGMFVMKKYMEVMKNTRGGRASLSIRDGKLAELQTEFFNTMLVDPLLRAHLPRNRCDDDVVSAVLYSLASDQVKEDGRHCSWWVELAMDRICRIKADAVRSARGKGLAYVSVRRG